MQIEHYCTPYLFARSLVLSRDVLDVARGEGYGSALLAQVARQVIGVDHSGDSRVRGAADNFVRPNLRHHYKAAVRGRYRWPMPAPTAWYRSTIEHFDRPGTTSCARCGACCARAAASSSQHARPRHLFPAGAPANPFTIAGRPVRSLPTSRTAPAARAVMQQRADRLGAARRHRIAYAVAGLRPAATRISGPASVCHARLTCRGGIW